MDRDKRRYPRREIELDLLCRKVGSTTEKWHNGRTTNISPSGLYFQTESGGVFKPGVLVNVELSIPPTTGLLEYVGRVSGFARVLRADEVNTAENGLSGIRRGGLSSASAMYGIAAEFCYPIRSHL